MSKLIVGSRGSKLAVTQTQHVIELLKKNNPKLQIKHVTITTTGDRDQTSALSSMGGKGVFVKEIEEALMAKKIDVAVHSMKDVPQELPSGLVLGPYPAREDCRDAFISRFGEQLHELPKGSTIGTSSPRRRAQIQYHHSRRDFQLVEFRGNLDTRLKKLQDGEVDGIVVALAGLKRLGLDQDVTQILEPEEMLPAPGQGCLALEIRAKDKKTFQILESIRDLESDLRARTERAFLQAIGGNCTVPLGLFSERIQDEIHLKASVLSLDGTQCITVEETGSLDHPELVGAKCAGRLLFEGGSDLL